MANETILREPTKDELRDFEPLQVPGGKFKSPQDKFNENVALAQQKAIKKGLPFATAAVRTDAKDAVSAWTNRYKRRGYVDKKSDPFPTLNFEKYSDLKNFEVVETDQKHDEYLSKIHRLPIYLKYTKYKYKGMSNTYTVMEPQETAVQRAVDALENRGKK